MSQPLINDLIKEVSGSQRETTVVLWQHRQEVLRCEVAHTTALEKLLKLFFGCEWPEIANFRAAVASSTTDLPDVPDALRQMIETAQESNASFRAAEGRFLVHAQELTLHRRRPPDGASKNGSQPAANFSSQSQPMKK